VGLSLFDERLPSNKGTLMDDTTAPGNWGVVPSASYAKRVDRLIVSSTDSVDHLLLLVASIYDSQAPIVLGFTLPAGQGTDGLTEPLDLVQLAAPGSDGMVVAPGDQWTITLDASPSAGTFLSFLALGGTL